MRSARRWLALVVAVAAAPVHAEATTIAVASNFARSAEQLAARYRREPGAGATEFAFSAASSGKLFAQIENGAPFDVFLSADAERPERLEGKGLVVPGSRITYAYGRLALWSVAPELKGRDCRDALVKKQFRHLALANPKTAPYGAAALAVISALGVEDVGERLVRGENIAQTLQFVASGSAQLGFVALAQLRGGHAPAASCIWEIPGSLHLPIAQQAVLLKRAAGNAAAAGFLRFLQSPSAQALIRDHGYALEP